MTEHELTTEQTWWDVERLITDLDRDGFDVDSIRTNTNPVSGGKRLIIDVSESKDHETA